MRASQKDTDKITHLFGENVLDKNFYSNLIFFFLGLKLTTNRAESTEALLVL